MPFIPPLFSGYCHRGNHFFPRLLLERFSTLGFPKVRRRVAVPKRAAVEALHHFPEQITYRSIFGIHTTETLVGRSVLEYWFRGAGGVLNYAPYGIDM